MVENKSSMSREEFLLQMDEILGLKTGTLRGDEKLEDLQNWDSTALIGMVVLAEEANSAEINPDQIVGCTTVADVLRLAGVENSTN